MIQSWQDRLKAERQELHEKLGKLNRFLLDDTNLNGIEPKHQALLIAQVYTMTAYLDILDMRLTYVDK
jgi:hypothetical protein